MTEQHQAAGVPTEHDHPGPIEYVKVAVVLAVATILEVALYYITALSDAVVVTLLILFMVIKFALVVLWFMHLKFDSRLFRRLFVAGIVLALAIYTVVLVTL